jgi:hypothetical protein
VAWTTTRRTPGDSSNTSPFFSVALRHEGMGENPDARGLVSGTHCLYWNDKTERQETAMHFQAHDLVFLIPMALVGVIAMGSIPVTARYLKISCRTMGALIGALVAVLVLEALPLLI